MNRTHARERAFYDARAREAGASAAPRPPDSFERSLLEALGPVDGLRVLELGCGTGDLSLELLRRGANLTALDLSPASVEVVRERARRFAPRAPLELAVATAEDTGLEDGAFDRVVGKWILHHAEVARVAREVARVLRPGGGGVFFENQDRNPLLRFARRRLMAAPGVQRVGTADERPLSKADFAVLRATFAEVTLEYPNLYCFEALGRALGHRAIIPLRRLDAGMWRRVPALRPYSYHVLIRLANSPGRARSGRR